MLTFDAMLSRLAEKVLADGGAASPGAQRIRDRYDAVLVDEFQDTDASQWTVLEAAFLGHKRLILIGDPKQAIYAFRGADVFVYLRAAASVEGSPAAPTMPAMTAGASLSVAMCSIPSPPASTRVGRPRARSSRSSVAAASVSASAA